MKKICNDCPAAENNFGGWLHCSLYDDYYQPSQKACTIKFLNEQIKDWPKVQQLVNLVDQIKEWVRRK